MSFLMVESPWNDCIPNFHNLKCVFFCFCFLIFTGLLPIFAVLEKSVSLFGPKPSQSKPQIVASIPVLHESITLFVAEIRILSGIQVSMKTIFQLVKWKLISPERSFDQWFLVVLKDLKWPSFQNLVWFLNIKSPCWLHRLEISCNLEVIWAHPTDCN